MKHLLGTLFGLGLMVFQSSCAQAQVQPLLTPTGGAVAPKPVTIQPREQKTLRLFTIGNSFSDNAIRFLPDLAKEGGYNLTIGRAQLGGAPLEAHWQGVEVSEKDPADPKGKLYGGKSLRELLGAGTWDVVTIQQGSFVSAAIATYQPYATQLRDFIQQLQPNAEVVMHQTWAYRSDANKFGAVRPNHLAATQEEMWQESRAAYQTTAQSLGIPLLPVGDAFWRVAADPKWGYKKDANYDFANPVYPNLPDQTYSLNEGYAWSAEKKLNLDANHANDAGCYLAGLVWYGALFHESPEKVTFVPPKVDADFAAYLRGVAGQTLRDRGLL